MSTVQQRAGIELLAAALSAKGLETSNNIRKMNHVAGRLLDQFDEGRYFFAVMGTPSAEEPWGFQFQGHHLVINYFVLGDHVVMTPTFMGSEPRTGHDDDGTEIDDTYFAWTGPTTEDAAYYLRIQSAVIYIEFDCESGGPANRCT